MLQCASRDITHDSLCWSVLQCVVVCCSVRCCSVLQCASRDITHDSLCCSVLQCVVVCCSALPVISHVPMSPATRLNES